MPGRTRGETLALRDASRDYAHRVFQQLGGGGCHKFVPILGGDGTKIAPPGDIFDQLPGKMN